MFIFCLRTKSAGLGLLPWQINKMPKFVEMECKYFSCFFETQQPRRILENTDIKFTGISSEALEAALYEMQSQSESLDQSPPVLTPGLKLVYDFNMEPRFVFFGTEKRISDESTYWYAVSGNTEA